MNSRRLSLTLIPLLIALLWSGQVFAADWTETDVFVNADEVAQLIAGGATVVDARETADFEGGHIEGAANLRWQDFVDGEGTGELVGDDQRLTRLLRQAGVSNDKPVVVYGNWSNDGAWGEEGRLFWTLEYLGHEDVRILEGGLAAWRGAGNLVALGQADEREAGDFVVRRQDNLRVTTNRLLRAVTVRNTFEIVDTREAEEYAGVVKYGEARGGHIPGAHHIWWRDLFDENGELLSPQAVQRKLQQRGIDSSDDIVLYCTGGVRSGFVYAVLRAKGFDNIRNYDASMWDWTSNGAPVSTP